MGSLFAPISHQLPFFFLRQRPSSIPLLTLSSAFTMGIGAGATTRHHVIPPGFVLTVDKRTGYRYVVPDEEANGCARPFPLSGSSLAVSPPRATLTTAAAS